jgi:fumarate reductase subunit C
MEIAKLINLVSFFQRFFHKTLYFTETPKMHNATLSGKKLLAKIVNGVKQPTVFSCTLHRTIFLVLVVHTLVEVLEQTI